MRAGNDRAVIGMVGVLTLSCGILLWRTVQLREDLGALSLAHREVEVTGQQSIIRAYAFESILRDLALPPAFQSVIEDARPAGMDSPALVYWTSPSCPACAANMPALLSLAAERPGQVVGLAAATQAAVDSAYGPASGRFPIVTTSAESMRGVFPRNVVPLTVVLRNGRIVRRIVGTLGPEELAEIRDSLTVGVPEKL